MNPSWTIVREVAEVENVDPTELRAPLFDVIDVDALDRFFEVAGCGADTPEPCVSFRYLGYDVTVYGDGRVHVSDPDGGPSSDRRVAGSARSGELDAD